MKLQNYIGAAILGFLCIGVQPAHAVNNNLPSDYIGPRSLGECEEDINYCADAIKICGQSDVDNKYKQNANFCSQWSKKSWGEVKAFFADCYGLQWSRNDEILDNTNWNFSVPGKPYYAYVNQSKRLSATAACEFYFPVNKDAISKGLDNLDSVTPQTCEQFGNACGSVYEACGMKGAQNPLNDPKVRCNYIFENSNLVAGRKFEVFSSCLILLNEQKPITEKCATLKSENTLLDQCQCGGQIGSTIQAVKSEKKNCCIMCRTAKVTYGQEQLDCSAVLGKPITENCSCNGFNQKFIIGDKSQGSCCAACNINSFSGKVLSTTFNGENLKCQGSELAPQKDVKIPGIKKFENPLKTSISSPQAFLGNIIKTVLGMVGTIAFALVVYGGFMWMVSAGNAEKVKMGQQTIFWAAIGLVAISASYAIVSFIIEKLG